MLYILRRSRKLWIAIIIIITALPVKSITISGSEPSYAGRSLEFMTWTDPVSKNERPVFQLIIDEKGNFSTEVRITENLFCFCDLGIFRGEIILVPDENIKLKLPPVKPKSFEESKNPYFEPVEIWLKVNEGSEKSLTNLVSLFDNRFYRLIDQYFNQLYYRNLKNYQDTIRKKLDTEFSTYTHPYFLSHRKIRFTSLEAEMARTGREKIIGTLNNIKPADWDQPAFTSFVNSLFVNTLSNESKSTTGSRIKQWIRDKNMAEFKKWAAAFTGSTSPLTELVMIKMLHDAFYSGVFSKPAILQILRSDYFSQHTTPEINRVSLEVTSKLSYLEKGSIAPGICLPMLSRSTWCTTSNIKPYLYILFADLDIPVCQEQVKYLKTMADACGSDLQIVLVVPPPVKLNIVEFIDKNLVPGMVLIDSEDHITGKKYRVRSYPSAFLLDISHRVLLVPAKTPLDGFEFQFESFKK